MFFSGRQSWVQSPDKGIEGKEEPPEKNKIDLNRKQWEKGSEMFSEVEIGYKAYLLL